MSFRHAAVAALLLALLPEATHAQDARITPVLSTTHERICDGETSNLTLVNAGQEVAGGQPTIEYQTRGLRVTRTTDGYRFLQTVDAPAGDIVLRFNASPSGVASNASLSGSTIEAYAAASPETNMAELAAAYADDVPERLLVGQSFAVGDSYYPADLQRSLISRMLDTMGLPFPADGSIDLRYRGEVMHQGRRAWRFTGPMTLRGAGELDGQPVSIDQTTRSEVLHDVETGLVIFFKAEVETRLDLNGRPFLAARTTDGYQCRIVPQES